MAFAPANVPPVAVQELALVELHVSVEDPPPAIGLGLAVSVATGTGAMLTVAVAGVLVPPAPVQVNEYVVLVVKAPVLWLPLAAFVPANEPPVTVQDVALVELQVNMAAAPLLTVVGDALIEAVGMGLAGATVTVATDDALVPPEPVQVSE